MWNKNSYQVLKQSRKNEKGFTLIELIVVIAVLGVLIAVMAPNLVGYVHQAQESSDEANEQIIGTALSMVLANENISFEEIASVTFTKESDTIWTVEPSLPALDVTTFSERINALVDTEVGTTITFNPIGGNIEVGYSEDEESSV